MSHDSAGEAGAGGIHCRSGVFLRDISLRGDSGSRVDRDHAVGTVCPVEAAVPSLASEAPPDDDLSLMPLKVYPWVGGLRYGKEAP